MEATDPHKPYDFETFRRYQSGEMSVEDQHRLERQMLDDPLTADAYEGFLLMLGHSDETQRVGLDLSGALGKRVGAGNKRKLPIWSYAAAASVILSVGAFWLVFISNRNDVKHAAQSERHVMARPEIAPKQEAAQELPLKPAPAPRSNSARPAPPDSPLIAAETPAGDEKKVDQTKLEEAVLADEAEERVAVSEPLPRVAASPSSIAAVPPQQVLASSSAAREQPGTIAPNQVVAKRASQGNTLSPDSLPVPAIGWQAYQAYLQKNTVSELGEGDVTVFFMVNANGTLSDFSAVGTDTLRGRAIEIVQKGPSWTAAGRKAVKASAPMHIRLLFRAAK
jgi:hypothetical protein